VFHGVNKVTIVN